MSLAFLFPGQGSQAVGMGVELAETFAAAREVFAEVDDALGQKLFHLMKEGPEAELTLTQNAQPALMAVSLAVVRTLSEHFNITIDGVAYVAGHSLGEYSALAAAEAISLSDTARLLKLRGLSMQKAVPVGEGAMASLIGPKVDVALAEEAARAGAEIGDAAGVVDEADGVGVDVLLLGDVGLVVGEVVAVGELDGGTGDAEVVLVKRPGGTGHLLPLVGEGRRGDAAQGYAGERCPGAGRVGGAGLGGEIFRVDGDGLCPCTLGEDGAGEAEGSATDDCDVGLRGVAAGEGEIEGDLAGSPGERPP